MGYSVHAHWHSSKLKDQSDKDIIKTVSVTTSCHFLLFIADNSYTMFNFFGLNFKQSVEVKLV